jgi:acetyl-CoA synthetase
MTASEHDAPIEPSIEAYRFFEREWDDYAQLSDAFEWVVPDQFNAATFLCDRWAEAAADRVALVVVDPDGTDAEYTYGQLQRTANQLADCLVARGVGRGDRIAVSGSQKLETLATHLAAWKLGAATVPLSVRFGPDGLEYRLRDSGATAFVVDEASLPALRGIEADCEALETVLVVGDAAAGDEEPFREAVDGRSTDVETATVDAVEPATVMYTSGTTGPPKGVVHPHRSLLGVLPSHVLQARNMAVRDDDLLYSPAEWSWLGPLYQGILPSLYYGDTILGDAAPGFDPERIFELVNRYGITVVGGATTVYRFMMQVPQPGERYDLSSLRVVIGAGEALGQTVVEWWRDVADVAVHEAYGQTEAGVFVGDCEALGVPHEPGRMGKPVPGYEVRVADADSTEPVEPGDLGEIAVRYDGNPGCFSEYWNAPAETDRTVRDGWLLTEDVGSQTDDGYLSFHSRADDVIVSSGYRLGPAEIEECLAAHDAVANAGVIGVPDDTRGEIPKAFVQLAEGDEPTDELAERLQGHVKERLARHEYPRELEFVAELPLTTTGKVRRHDLRDREGLAE